MPGHRDIVNVGLAGCGQIARSVHLRVLRNLRGARLIAIAEPDIVPREAASRLAPGAFVVGSYQQLLARDDVEAVVLALPTGWHAAAAIAAFDAGKHVYLEKPLATSLSDAEAVLQAWRRTDRVGMIGFNYRFNRLYQRARELIRNGMLGKPVAVRSVFATAAASLPAWKATRDTGGGVLLDLGSHHIDLIRFLFDTHIQDVACDVRSQDTEGDTAFVRFRLGNGATVQSFFSFRAVDEDRFEVYGTAGKLTIDRCHAMDVERRGPGSTSHRGDQVRHWLRSLQRVHYGVARRRAYGHEPSWQLALEHFFCAVRGEHPAQPDLHDGFESLKVVMALEQAARLAQPQKV